LQHQPLTTRALGQNGGQPAGVALPSQPDPYGNSELGVAMCRQSKKLRIAASCPAGSKSAHLSTSATKDQPLSIFSASKSRLIA
jgi:hypothetical protein